MPNDDNGTKHSHQNHTSDLLLSGIHTALTNDIFLNNNTLQITTEELTPNNR
jgi:hypothetical protein